MEKKPVIIFRDFSFQYFAQAEPTLRHIDLTIYEGEKVLIVGASGSGKSTLGNCINGLIPFSYEGEIQGSCQICGKETRESGLFDICKSVGTVLQDPDGQFIGLSVGEDVAFALENDCVEQEEMKRIVADTAKITGVHEILSASPFALSGGQKQKVALTGVLVNEVDVLLFDEPLANLDPATGKAAIEIIDRIHREYGKTVVIIEHRLEDVLYRPVDRIVVMEDGQIVADASPDVLLSGPLLGQLGIREPLYIPALRYAGCNVTEELEPGRLATLHTGPVAPKIESWCDRQPVPSSERSGEELLRAEHLRFSYDGVRPALQGVSFTLYQGEMVSIVGTNGAGKSTLAKAICGLVEPVEGEVLLKGVSLRGQTIKERAERIGYVMQNPNQMICKPMIYEEIAFGLQLRGYPKEEIDERVQHAMEICGLLPFRRWPVSALSFGQKKRVTIASMLTLQPSLLILDEPTAGQDYRHYTEIMEFLRKLNEKGVTIVMITHDMHLMLEYTRRSLVIHGGQVLYDGPSVGALTSPEIVTAANLKLTSLYELALRCGLRDPQSFVYKFIAHERRGRDERQAV